MGMLAEPEQFIRDLRLRKKFTVCDLGDQWVTHLPKHRLARDLYKELGCWRYEAIDGNGRGTITADLNRPLRPHPGQFDLVTDLGTGEHVFNQAQVWATLHSLMRVGGHLVFDRPVSGYPRHCYYYICEDLVRDIAAANNYDVVCLEHRDTTRGRLVRGVLQRTTGDKFVMPQQGRYKKLLRPITVVL